MANPAYIYINECEINSGINKSHYFIDTNGPVPCPADGRMDRLIFEMVNNSEESATVTFQAGEIPVSWPNPLVITLAASGEPGDAQIVGPFSSAQFQKTGGSIKLDFDGGETPDIHVAAYRLPRSTTS